MGKLVMPKNSAVEDEIKASMKVYYDANEWLSNENYINELMKLIGSDQDRSAYTKKIQIASYFGFAEWEDITDKRSLRRLTPLGREFYESWKNNDSESMFAIIMYSLEHNTFGRNNFGCPESDSDVEPPKLFIRACIDLKYLTYKELAYLLWKLEDVGENYTDALNDIKQFRISGSVDYGEEANKYADCKPIMMLNRWGFLSEDDSNSTGGKHIVINPKVYEKYETRLKNLKIYNIDMDMDNKTPDTLLEVIFDGNTAYSEEDLARILAEMCELSDSKATAVHMFGIKFGYEITRNDYSVENIVKKSGLNDSYSVEVRKGIRIFDSIAKNQYGIRLLKKSNNLPIRQHRIRNIHELNQILYGAPGTGKTYSTAKYAIAIVEGKKLSEYDSLPRANLMEKYNKYVSSGQIVFTTFHQNYGYEDFVQGLRPNTTTGNVSFILKDGIFKELSFIAMHHPEKDYVLIIDEINRANISKVFGELITLIEPDKRWGEENAFAVTLPSGEIFAVPNNLYIVGTMNSADKSIALIDTALRRRFKFVEVPPKAILITDRKLQDIFIKLNETLRNGLDSSDLLVGHAYFIGKQYSDLETIFNDNVIPLLYEYYFGDEPSVYDTISTALGTNSEYNIIHNTTGKEISRIRIEKK